MDKRYVLKPVTRDTHLQIDHLLEKKPRPPTTRRDWILRALILVLSVTALLGLFHRGP